MASPDAELDLFRFIVLTHSLVKLLRDRNGSIKPANKTNLTPRSDLQVVWHRRCTGIYAIYYAHAWGS